MSLINKLTFWAACGLLGLLIGLTLGQCAAKADPLTVAVLDTGISAAPETIPLCKTGHRDFTGEGLRDIDLRHHGTNVAALISLEAGTSPNYCLIIIKIFPKGDFNILAYINALQYVDQHRYDFVNMSFAGTYPMKAESRLIKSILDHGTHVIVSAGNNSQNLDARCNVYPACLDDRLIVVSAPDVYVANMGSIVDMYVSGANQAGGGVILSGTSQAAARATGILIKQKLETTHDK